MSRRAASMSGRHVDQLVLDGLELGDGAAELLALLGVLAAPRRRRPAPCRWTARRWRCGRRRECAGCRRSRRPRARAAAFPAGGSFRRCTSPVALARSPSLFSFLPAAEPGRAFLDDEGRDAVLRGGAVGDRHGHADIGVVGVGGEGLGAVEHPARRLRARPCVRVPAASEPASGSVSDQQPSHSPVASLGM